MCLCVCREGERKKERKGGRKGEREERREEGREGLLGGDIISLLKYMMLTFDNIIMSLILVKLNCYEKSLSIYPFNKAVFSSLGISLVTALNNDVEHLHLMSNVKLSNKGNPKCGIKIWQ